MRFAAVNKPSKEHTTYNLVHGYGFSATASGPTMSSGEK